MYREILDKIVTKTDNMLDILQEDVKRELIDRKEELVIYSTLCERKEIPFLPDGLFLVQQEDQKEEKLNFNMLNAAVKQGFSIVVDKVFLEEDLRLNGQKENVIKGKITTNQDEYIIQLKLIQDKTYINEVRKVQTAFIDNNMCMEYANVPYFYHFYQVVLDEDTVNLKRNEIIIDLRISYEDRAGKSIQDLVPVWNIKKSVATTRGLRELCGDQICFMHSFPKDKELLGRLIVLPNYFKGKVIQNQEHTIVYQTPEVIEKWSLLEFHAVADSGELAWPLFSNALKKEFIHWYEKKYGRMIRSRAEIDRIVRAYEASEYVEYCHCEVLSEINMLTYELESLGLDDLAQYEEESPYLVLYFRVIGEKRWFTGDIIGFLTAEVQMNFVGYHVVGKLLEGEI